MFSSTSYEVDSAADVTVDVAVVATATGSPDSPGLPPPPDPPDLAGLSPAELVDRFRALVAERRRLDAEIAAFVHRMHLSGRYVEDGHRTVNAWCRASIRCSDSEATTMRRVGRLLAGQPDVAACAATGRLGTMQLERLARTYANPRCGHLLADFLPLLLRHAVHLSHREFDLVIDRWTALADIDGSTRAHDQAIADRAVTDATHIRLPDSDPRRWWCETVDGSPLPVADVLAAAVIGHIRRITLDSAGVVVDVGRRRRTLTGPAREAVMAIGGECDWAGCNVSAARCQADHLNPWRHDGPTSTRNKRPRCGQHNRMRNLGWELHGDHDGYWHTLRPDGTGL